MGVMKDAIVTKLTNRLNLLIATVAVIGILWGGIKVFGFKFITPEESVAAKFDNLEEYHNTADSIHADLSYLATEHDEHLEEQLKEIKMTNESLTIRFCLRDTYEELALQKMLPTCTRLGIIRTPNDQGVRTQLSESGGN